MKIGGTNTIDFARVSKFPKFVIDVKSRDRKRAISLILLENNTPINLNNYTVTVAAKKSDGNDIFNDVTVVDAKNGICEVEVTEQMLALDTDLPCEIVLYGEDGTVATSSNFVIGKISSVRDENSIISSSEFTGLTKALSEVKNIDNRFKEVNSQLEHKANKLYVNSKIWSMANMGQDVKEAMTGGSVAVVGKDTILSENIVDSQVTASKLASSAILNEIDFDKLPITCDTTSLYIQPFQIERGLISIKVKAKEGESTFYLLKRIVDNQFKIIDSLTFDLQEGINNIENLWIVEDEDFYIGFKTSNGVNYDNEAGEGFYEVKNFSEDMSEFLVEDYTHMPYKLGLQVICNHSELLNNTLYKVNMLKEEIDNNFEFIFPRGGQQIQDMSFVESSDTQVIPTSIYIPNMPIKVNGRGEITVNSYGEFAVYIFEKTSSNTFKLKYKQVFNSIGMNTHSIDYDLREGDYIGLHGEIKYFKDGNVGGFYECEEKNISDITDIGGTLEFDAANTTISGDGYEFAFGFFLDIHNRYINPDLVDMSKIDLSNADFSGVELPNVPDESKVNLTDFNLLNFSEIDNEVGFLGRWFDANINGFDCKCTINAGSEFYFKVKGATTVNVNFEINSSRETPFFSYSIDGSDFTRQLITSPTLPTLTTEEHIIRVVIDGLTETEDKWVGEKGIAFKNITVDSGTVKGVIPKNKTIMFFGDSITEGVRSLNMDANANGNSSINAFPFQCCKNLNSVSYRVGFGATGVAKPNGSGGIPDCLTYIDNMTQNKETPYYEPNIVVINHGTNDGGYTSDTFIPAYNKVLDRLTIKYPGVPIFAIIPFNQSHSSDIRNCVSNRSNCYLVETDSWGVTYTDGLHPDANGAQIAGEKLANEIINVLGKSYFI